MTQKEQTRLQVLNSVLADQVPVCQAAEVLGVSERHMRRILAAYRKEGAAALDCCQSAKVGQIGTREDYCYEELRVSSLRVLL